MKFTDRWEEEEEDGTKILHDRERFSHELTLVFANGKTRILTHEKKSARKVIDFKGTAMSSGFAIVIGASPLDCCQSAADYYSPDDLNEAGN